MAPMFRMSWKPLAQRVFHMSTSPDPRRRWANPPRARRDPTSSSPPRSTRSMRCRPCSPDWGPEMAVSDVAGQPAPEVAPDAIASFADVPLYGERTGEPATEEAVGKYVVAAAAAHGYTAEQLDWATPEGIDVKPVYIAADRDAVVDAGSPLDSFPGAPPFVRGPYPTMYVNQPWTIRQYAGFSTAAESNAFYRRNLAAGKKGL